VFVLNTEVLLPSKALSQSSIQSKMPLTEDKLRQIIRDMNLKVTTQRMLILQTLHKGRMHVTAQEVFERVSEVDSSVGFATVYRFLRSLTDYGHVTEIKIGGMPARYELAPEGHHDHLTCVKCGKICEFENEQIENLQLQVAQQLGFKLTHHVLELYGICTECDQLAR
jgi:Fur family ferric uptake transcriptional regulator